MNLIFKQKLFSRVESYNVTDEQGNKVYVVKGHKLMGRLFKIYDKDAKEVGAVKEKVFNILPKFVCYVDNQAVGFIKKKFSFFKPKFDIDYKGWMIDGNLLELNYKIIDGNKNLIATVKKEILNLTDTYKLEINNDDDALSVLMLAIAIDEEKKPKKRS